MDLYSLIVLIVCFFIVGMVYYFHNYVNEAFVSSRDIPKRIIQTWKTKIVPDKYVEWVNSLKKHNPDYEIMLFDDNDCDSFVRTKLPKYYTTYKKLPFKIQRIDFFRYLAVYYYGGFYFDLDIKCHKSLNKLLEYSVVFPVEKNMTVRSCERAKIFKRHLSEDCLTFKNRLGQYSFGAVPKHPFILSLIENIHNNINSTIIMSKTLTIPSSLYNIYIYETTGPDMVTKMYNKYHNKKEIKLLHNKKIQQFGTYCSHIDQGTWK